MMNVSFLQTNEKLGKLYDDTNYSSSIVLSVVILAWEITKQQLLKQNILAVLTNLNWGILKVLAEQLSVGCKR